MKSSLLVLFLFISELAIAKTIVFSEFTLEIPDSWVAEKESNTLRLESGNGANIIEISPVRMHGGTTFEDVVNDKELGEYRTVGIFMFSKENLKFNLYEGTWERTWLAYSRDVVMLVKNESREEEHPEIAELVESVLNLIRWSMP